MLSWFSSACIVQAVHKGSLCDVNSAISMAVILLHSSGITDEPVGRRDDGQEEEEVRDQVEVEDDPF